MVVEWLRSERNRRPQWLRAAGLPVLVEAREFPKRHGYRRAIR